MVPNEIQLMADKRSIDVYLKLLESGSEKKRDIRLVVVGKKGAGKTSLIRRLFGEDITDVTSTNGIEIHKIKCKAMSDDGIWNKLDGTNGETEIHARLLKPFKERIEASVEEGVHQTVKENTPSTSFDESETVTQQPKKRKIQVTTESQVEPPVTSQQLNISLDQTQMDIEAMLKSGVDFNDKEEYATLFLWDFAGDKEFYHTHQTFLSQDAIYLVVTKLNEADNTNAQEMFQLWMNSIHCYCRLDDQKNEAKSKTGEMHERMIAKDDCLDPPVVLVGSHRDKVEHSSGQTIEDACKERMDKYTQHVSDDACKHIREEYFISNTEDENSKFKHIRQGILNLARTMRAWNKDYPLKFIQLEKLLQEKKKNLNIPIISLKDIKSISTESPKPLSDEELTLYLKFHHEIRSLVYFEDLPDYIILDTQWLSDAFKHIVTAEKFQSSVRRYWNKSKWNDLRNRGVLHSEVLEDIFKQDETILKYKYHILNVMEKFDIIIRPNISERDAASKNLCYYVPCMIKEESQRDIYEMLNLTENNFEKSTWLYFVFRFLPPHLMNHLIASLCRKYNLTEVVVPNQQKRIALLRDAAVFEVQMTKLRKLLVSTGPNSIQIQVWEFGPRIERGLYKPIAIFVREELENIINTRFKMSNVKFEERWECGLTKSKFVTGTNGFSGELSTPYRCETCDKTHEFIGEWSGQPDDVYDKKEGQKGLVLIVNFMFSGRRKRQGSEVDVTNLSHFFTELGYQVECRSDMTKEELKDCFQNIESKYLTEKSKDYHSFICVIMSHGNEKGISTKEENGMITEHEITEPFKNKEGGKFNGKPKLFLFQYCRGHQKQMKVVVPDSDEPSGSIGIDSNDALVNKVPTDADILVAHATTPGYYSFRDTEDGAYFIQAFLSIAKQKYKLCHVEEMLIDVRRKLAKNPEHEIQVGRFAGSCQTSVSQSTYIKKFFL
ncbi:uncharacterized protein [Mytilus edulis]|uniref:uncharacterized protein n=1 Tax=Mytilus edulis TaxID=6550 RepID=UPI0039EFFFC9